MNVSSDFVGREAELDAIVTAWESVLRDEGPQMVVLLGESGLGKTRLVGTFYERLAARTQSRDGERGYWPSTLPSDATNLALNPLLDEVDQQHPPAFLWWGMRLVNPRERNQVHAGAVSNYLPALTPHVHALQASKRKRQALGKLGKVAAKVGANFVPGLGALVESGENLRDLYGAGRELISSSPDDVAAVEQQARKDVNDSVLDIVMDVVRARGEAGGVPIVIVVDEAHFSSSDPGVEDLFERLVTASLAGRWPILFLVTHWRWEWRDTQSRNGEKGIAAVVERTWRPAHPDWVPIVLEPLPPSDLEPLLTMHLPGLTRDQVSRVLAKVAGQPGVLSELVKVCLGRKRYFVDRDPTKPFSEKGMEQVLALPSNFITLAEERLADLPSPVAQLISLSSMQGLRLSRRLNQQLVERLGGMLDDPTSIVSDETFAHAQDPYAALVPLSDTMAQFAQRVVLEAARNRLSDALDVDEDEVIEAWRNVLRDAYQDASERATVEERDLLAELVADAFAEPSDDEEAWLAADAHMQLLRRARRRMDTRTATELARTVILGMQDEKWSPNQLGFRAVREVYQALKVGHVVDDALYACDVLVDLADDDAEAYQAAVRRGDARRSMRDMDGALDEWQRAHRIAAEAKENHGGEDWQRDWAWAEYRIAKDARERGETDAAIEGFDRAVRVFEDLAEEPEYPGSKQGAATVHRFVGAAWKDQGNFDKAMEHFGRALAINEERVAMQATEEARRGLSISLGDVGDTYLQTDNVEQAIAMYRRALDINEALFDSMPTPTNEVGVCISLNRVGRALARVDRIDEALALHRRALEIGQTQFNALGTPTAEEGLAFTLKDIADIHRSLGEHGDALEGYMRAAEIWERAAKAQEGRLRNRRSRQALAMLRLAHESAEAYFSEDASDERQAQLRQLEERIEEMERESSA